MAFKSDAARRAFFFALKGKGAFRGARRAFSRTKTTAETVRKSTAGEFASQVIDSASGHEFAKSISTAAAKKPVIESNLQRFSNRILKGTGKAGFKFKRRVLRSLRKNPILSTGFKISGRVGTLTGRVGGRAVESLISTAQGTPRVAKARSLGQIVSDEFIDSNMLRETGRTIRRSKGSFTKHVTKPISELLTGKVTYQKSTSRGPGLGAVANRRYGILQGLRRSMSRSYTAREIKDIRDPFADTVIRGKARKNILDDITERRKLRSGYVSGVREAKKALKDQVTKGLMTPAASKTQLKQARKGLRSRFGEELKKSREIYRREKITDPDTGLAKRVGKGKLVEKYGKMYRGADTDLITTGLVGGATAAAGVQSFKAFGEKLRRERYMREKRKESDVQKAQIYTQLRINHPDWDEYDLENAVNLEYRRRQLIQVRAADNIGFRDIVLSATPQSPKPVESRMKAVKKSPSRLRTILIGGKKKSSKKRK